MELRLCMFELRRKGLNAKTHEFECHIDLRLCILERRWPYSMDLLFRMPERREEFDGDMELRFCMFERLRSYGFTFMHI